MCENMVVFEVCAVFEVLCSVPDVHYTESGNSSISDEDKGRHASPISIKRRHALWGRISYLNKREMLIMGAHLPYT
jgi:hypothetical protein